jgi:hypothetical protein
MASYLRFEALVDGASASPERGAEEEVEVAEGGAALPDIMVADKRRVLGGLGF